MIAELPKVGDVVEIGGRIGIVTEQLFNLEYIIETRKGPIKAKISEMYIIRSSSRLVYAIKKLIEEP